MSLEVTPRWLSAPSFWTLTATAHIDVVKVYHISYFCHFFKLKISAECGWSLTPTSCCAFLLPDVWAETVIPETSIDVIKGQMVVLKASYRTDPNHDLSTDTILWNFFSNKTEHVRFFFRATDHLNVSIPGSHLISWEFLLTLTFSVYTWKVELTPWVKVITPGLQFKFILTLSTYILLCLQISQVSWGDVINVQIKCGHIFWMTTLKGQLTFSHIVSEWMNVFTNSQWCLFVFR